MTPSSDGVVTVVDAGTGSVRAVAFDSAGTVVAQAAREWQHPAVTGHPSGRDFDTKSAWKATCDCLSEVVTKLGNREILAVCASSMREGFVLYDGDGVEIFACPNTDGRASSQADRLVESGVAAEIYRRAGDWISITAPARLLWLGDHAPDILKRSRHLGMLSDWITYRLSGRFVTDPTCGSSTALFDLPLRDWATDLVATCGLAVDVLPEVLEPGSIAGAVTASAAAETGLPAGTPVVVGGADTQLALHGIAADQSNPTLIAGTFWQTTMLSGEPTVDPHRRLRTLCAVGPQQWMVEGIGFLSGLALRWFRDGFCPDAIELGERTGRSGYQVMEEWASSVPAGSNGVLALLSNVMQADSWRHGSPTFVNFDIGDPQQYGRAAFIRAIEEAAAYVTRAHLDILNEVLPGRVSAGGHLVMAGGSSSGDLWPGIVASVVGMPVRLSTVTEATSYGAARLAAGGVGLELPAAPTRPNPVEPNPVEHDLYDRLYMTWRSSYAAYERASSSAGLRALFTPPGALPPSLVPLDNIN